MRKIFLPALVFLQLASFAVFGHEDGVYKPEVKVEKLLETTTTSIGQAIQYPRDGQARLTFLKVTIPPGAETGWHTHPVPGAGYILSGKLSLFVAGEKTIELVPGQAFAETINTLHNGKNLGTEPVVLLVTWLGEEGRPFTVKGTAP